MYPRLRRDTKVIVSTIAAAFALFGAEGYAVEARQGKSEAEAGKRKAREDGSGYRRAGERVLRSGGLSEVVGLCKSVCFYAQATGINLPRTVNVGVLGIVGYLAYTNWKRPSWDRRIVSATSAGLIALWGTEM
jgi:hypothetical protein